jgi:hypothetical protein
MEISITKNNVYQYAMALTARAATATGAYMQTAITEDNYPMLDVYLSEAVSTAEGELRKKLSGSHSVDMNLEEDTLVILTKEQWRAEASVYKLIESGIRLFLAYYVASRWLQTSPASSLAEVYGTTAATHLMTAAEALNQKEKFRVDEADYSDRDGEGSAMNQGSENASEYTRKKADNVMARPGVRIVPGEILTVLGDGGEPDPAMTIGYEHLITNQQAL